MIVLSGISKSFAGIPALNDVSLTARAGTVHGVLGENGAGKSTLMNVLFGLVRSDSGTITLGGTPVHITSPADARRLGIGMVHQHFALVPTLTVADNLALALQPGLGRVDRGAWRARITAEAARLRWTVDPDACVADLTVGQQQRVELLKALVVGADGSDQEVKTRVLILDEPTAVLTPQEVDELLASLRTLAADGATVLFISHKLAEVERVCDDVSVLRRGRLVHSGPLAGTTRERLVELMIGGALSHAVRQAQPAAVGAPDRVRFADVSVGGRGAPLQLDRVSFTLRAGEIVGIAGVDGNGQGALVDVVLGLRPPDSGSVWLAPGGRAVIPDDRQAQALVMPFSLIENLLLTRYRQPGFSRHGWSDYPAWRAHASALVMANDVRGPGLDAPVAALSGGNQQKAVIARELHGDTPLVIAVNPTRGLDVGATAAVLRRLGEARDAGAGVLLVHSDLDELLAVSDRVLVIASGRLVDSGWPQCDRAHLGRLMLGAATPGSAEHQLGMDRLDRDRLDMDPGRAGARRSQGESQGNVP